MSLLIVGKSWRTIATIKPLFRCWNHILCSLFLRHQNGFRLPMCQCHSCWVDVTSGSWHAYQRPFLVFSVVTAEETQEQWSATRTSRAHFIDTRIPSVCLCQNGTWTWIGQTVNCFQTDRSAPRWSARMSDLRLLIFPRSSFCRKAQGTVLKFPCVVPGTAFYSFLWTGGSAPCCSPSLNIIAWVAVCRQSH